MTTTDTTPVALKLRRQHQRACGFAPAAASDWGLGFRAGPLLHKVFPRQQIVQFLPEH